MITPGGMSGREIVTGRQKGVALLIVLWILLLVTISTGAYTLMARMDTLEAHTVLSGTRARMAAEAGMNLAVLALRNPDEASRLVPDGRSFMLQYQGIQVEIEVTDERGLLNVNTANEEELMNLFMGHGLELSEAELLAAAIKDWTDVDEIERAGGAELPTYETHGLGMGPGNRPFAMKEELLQVLGVSWDLFLKIEPAISVYSESAEVDPAFAPAEALLALPDVSEEDALNFVAERHSEDSAGGSELTLPNGQVAMARGRGSTYSILAKATLPNGVWDQIEATIRLGGTRMDSLTESCAGVKDSTIEQIMSNALEQKLQHYRGRIQSGPAGKFYAWWIDELKQAMPDTWQERLQHAQRRVAVIPEADSLRVGVCENRNLTTLETLPLSQDAALQQQQIADLLDQNDLLEVPRILLLNETSVLSKELSLPMAAEPNLAQVLAFEMDRQTPFKASSVYYDWEITERDGPSGQLKLKLFLVPRGEVDEAIKVVEGRGFSLTGVDIREGDQILGLNLLPVDQRSRTVNRTARINLILGFAAVGLLALVMTQSLYLRAHQVAELEDAIAEVQGKARSVMAIKERIKDTSEAAGFLAKKRSESPLAIALLADITRILPDDTHLDRLVIGKESVQMQGKSSNAQRLIELVNESELLEDSAFRGSTRLDGRTGLEIFEVNAAISAMKAGE